MSESANLISFDTRYSVPPVEAIGDSPAEIFCKQQCIARLKEERNAVILAHNYQRDEVQEIADYVGDSLGLSQQAAATPADVIVFCGVHFMAETAAILCPEKTVLLPDLRAGCSLAATISADELRAWKKRYPDAVVVAYVNTSAEVKAESDYCCTSANAAKVVRAIPADRSILFIPDKFLATVVARETGRANIIAYPGYCHVHRTIRPAQVLSLMEENPDIELLIHPECGCVSSCMARVADGTLPRERTFFLSTEGMMRHISESTADEVAIGTEVGMLHRLRKAAPEKLFRPVNPEAVCEFMKTITLDRILRSLEILEPQICVPPEIAHRARRAIDRMLEIA
ncbi:MAG TPA: quinolinate synthase NadA [Candidatus Acidoferrales bacterium]|nr:quinolinate synthase NadA [Candidatus Acidoferrales bacterium]